MKRIILAVACFIALPSIGLSAQAQRQGPMKIDVPNGADVDGMTIDQNDAGQNALTVSSGTVLLGPYTITQLNNLIASTTGQMVRCTDCTLSTHCVSSGTVTQGAWTMLQSTSPESGRLHCQ